ncbi:hypothetical protein [Aerolutibacter ruishenii]|nr:hypothetical protein [Lysobacter ruishenii]
MPLVAVNGGFATLARVARAVKRRPGGSVLDDLGAFACQVETVLAYARHGHLRLDDEVTTLLLRCGSHLEQWSVFAARRLDAGIRFEREMLSEALSDLLETASVAAMDAYEHSVG